MPPSVGKENEKAEGQVAGQPLAVLTEVLYLANLIFLPGVAFVILLWLYFTRTPTIPALAECHLKQTISASIWAGIMLLLVNALIILFGGYDSTAVWIIVILYFTSIHATFILLGTLGLAKAMAGKHYHYPLVGRPCSEGNR